MKVDEIIKKLQSIADPEVVAFKKAKYDINATNAIGVYMKDIKELAKGLPKEPQLAIELFNTGIYEAKLLCSKIFKPKDLTSELMEEWVLGFNNWEICDSFSMAVFAKSELAIPKILEWANREEEFQKRAAFATIAALCMADKKAGNQVFESFYPLILLAATDERNFVKKAVSWALRNIGKRNVDLNQSAIELAKKIGSLDVKSAVWISKDVLRELTKTGVRMSDYPRELYRN